MELFVLSAFLVSVCYGQETGSAIVFNTSEYDFGEVEDPSRPLSYTFRFMNVSDAPVRFAPPVPGCSCIHARISPETVGAGETGSVEVTFDPSGSAFRTCRTVGVYSAEGEHVHTLTVCAYVIPTDSGVYDRYPAVLADGLRATRTDVAFGYLYWDEPSSRSIGLINTGREALRIGARVLSSGEGLRVSCPELIVPGAEFSMVLEYDIPGDNGYRSGADSLALLVDGNAAPVVIHTDYILMGRLSGNGPHPSLRSYPSVSVLVKSPLSGRYRGKAELYNDGPAPLEIFAVTGDARTSLRSGTVLEPGGRLKVRASSGSPSFRLELFTNDPARPYKELIFKTDNQ